MHFSVVGLLVLTALSCAHAWQVPSLQSILSTPGDISSTARCNCSNTNDTGITGKSYVCRDPRLGPVILPRKFPMLSVVSDYDRFAGLPPGDFLAKWTDPQSGYYVYPPRDGFLLDENANPIMANATLPVGTKVDRFGSEYGSYVSAADAPYSQRALPPNNLDTDPTAPEYPNRYHVYTVIRPLPVLSGPIAPWFGQPGLGAQFYTGYIGNILSLIDLGYLERVNASAIQRGPGNGGPCDTMPTSSSA